MQFKLKETTKKFRGWSLYRLSKELNLETKTVYAWANGKVSPSLQNLVMLCKALGCTPNDLILVEENSERRFHVL